jgi:hypothetical protein
MTDWYLYYPLPEVAAIWRRAGRYMEIDVKVHMDYSDDLLPSKGFKALGDPQVIKYERESSMVTGLMVKGTKIKVEIEGWVG